MALTLHDLLQPQVLLDTASRIRKGQGALSRWFGFYFNAYDKTRGQLVGPNVKESPTRHGAYTIFNRTREVAQGRAPGAGPATWQPMPAGRVHYTIPRFHEKIRLDAEQLMHLAKIGEPNSVIDPMGQDYVVRQTEYIVTRFNNVMEMMCAGLIRGLWYLKFNGDDLYPTLTQPTGSVDYITVDHQIPDGNLNQLNMLGTGNIIDTSWSNVNAKVITQHLPRIMEAVARLSGYAFVDAFVSPVTWGYLMNNTEVINTAGSANQPFERFEYTQRDGQGMYPYPEWVSVLKGFPTIRWHILPEYLVLDGGTDPINTGGSGTLTPVIPDNDVVFLPPVGSDWVDGLVFREPISEKPGQPMQQVPQPWFWSETHTQPTCMEILGLLNFIPRLRIPGAIARATVIF